MKILLFIACLAVNVALLTLDTNSQNIGMLIGFASICTGLSGGYCFQTAQ